MVEEPSTLLDNVFLSEEDQMEGGIKKVMLENLCDTWNDTKNEQDSIPEPEVNGKKRANFFEQFLRQIQRNQVPLGKIEKSLVSDFTLDFHLCLLVAEDEVNYNVRQLLPLSSIQSSKFIQDFDLQSVVDILFISHTRKDLTKMNVFDIYIRLSQPISLESLELMHRTLVINLIDDLKVEFNSLDFQLDKRNKVFIYIVVLDIKDQIYQRQQSFQRSIFILKCFSSVSFPDDINFFYINQDNTIIEQDVKFEKKDNRFMRPKKRQIKEEDKLGTSILKFDYFKGTCQIWQLLKTSFQKQVWMYYASIMFSQQNQLNLQGEPLKGEVQNLLKIFPRDYQQQGFVNVNNTKFSVQNEQDQFEANSVQLNEEFKHNSQFVFNEWKRNKSTNCISRCLLIQAINELREQRDLRMYIDGDNYYHILSKSDSLFSSELLLHNNIEQQEIIHPHPCVQFKQQLYNGFSLEIDELLMFGPLFFLSSGTALKLLSYQLCVVDQLRNCDSGAIMLCGEQRSGKSVIMDGIQKCFGGYDWKKTNSNFQNEELQHKSVCCIEEMDIQQLKNEKNGCNMWKKRLDQTISCDIDIKCKASVQCLKYVPFVITTNKKPHFIRGNVEGAFHKRIKTVYFSHSVLAMINEINKYSDGWIKYKYEKSDQEQKQMTGNTCLLFSLLFPHADVHKRYLFVDDILVEHIVKILLRNQYSSLLRLYFSKQNNKLIQQIFTYYCSTFAFQNDDLPNAFQTWSQVHKQMLCNCPEYKEFLKAYLLLAHAEETVKEVLLSNASTCQQIGDSMLAMLIIMGEKQVGSDFKWYSTIDNVLSCIIKKVPESNVKRHLLRSWERIIQRLGY